MGEQSDKVMNDETRKAGMAGITKWERGKPLPPLDEPCPKCGECQLHHFIDYKNRRYVVTCYAKPNRHHCGYYWSKFVDLKNPKKK